MENSATSSSAALFQAINPALTPGQGGNNVENQSVISGEQFGALLQQLLGSGEGGGLDAMPIPQLLPQGGETLPLSNLGAPLLDQDMSGGLPQDQSLAMLAQQLKQLGQSLVGGEQLSSAQVLPESATVTDIQSLDSMDQALPVAFLMNLSARATGGNTGGSSIPLEVADTALISQPIPLPANILSHLKAKQAELSAQGETVSIKLENIQPQEEGVITDLFKTAMMPLMVRTSLPEGKGKEMDADLTALTGLHSSSNMGDRSGNALKSVAETATTNPMKSSWATMLDMPLASPQWKSEFGQRILMMTKEGVQTAEIRLNPAHLGPIEVRITLNDDQATINFSANHTLTRDAIENSMPRLRELFQSNGLMLADAQVSEQSPRDSQQRRQYEHQAMKSGSFAPSDEDINLGIASRSYYPSDQGLALAVDFYA